MSGPATRSGGRHATRPAGSAPDDTGSGRSARPEPSPPPPPSASPSPAPSSPPSAPSAPSAPAGSAPDAATDVVRWGVFSCFLVPVVLLWYGASLAGTAGTAFGLAAVTAACRVLLRRSERCAQQRGGRHTRGGTPVG